MVELPTGYLVASPAASATAVAIAEVVSRRRHRRLRRARLHRGRPHRRLGCGRASTLDIGRVGAHRPDRSDRRVRVRVGVRSPAPSSKADAFVLPEYAGRGLGGAAARAHGEPRAASIGGGRTDDARACSPRAPTTTSATCSSGAASRSCASVLRMQDRPQPRAGRRDAVEPPEVIIAAPLRPDRPRRGARRRGSTRSQSTAASRPAGMDEWLASRFAHPAFDPSLWRVAAIDGEIVGGISVFDVGDTGYTTTVGGAARRRGARASARRWCADAFAALRERGQMRVMVSVDADAARPARPLRGGGDAGPRAPRPLRQARHLTGGRAARSPATWGSREPTVACVVGTKLRCLRWRRREVSRCGGCCRCYGDFVATTKSRPGPSRGRPEPRHARSKQPAKAEAPAQQPSARPEAARTQLHGHGTDALALGAARPRAPHRPRPRHRPVRPGSAAALADGTHRAARQRRLPRAARARRGRRSCCSWRRPDDEAPAAPLRVGIGVGLVVLAAAGLMHVLGGAPSTLRIRSTRCATPAATSAACVGVPLVAGARHRRRVDRAPRASRLRRCCSRPGTSVRTVLTAVGKGSPTTATFVVDAPRLGDRAAKAIVDAPEADDEPLTTRRRCRRDARPSSRSPTLDLVEPTPRRPTTVEADDGGRARGSAASRRAGAESMPTDEPLTAQIARRRARPRSRCVEDAKGQMAIDLTAYGTATGRCRRATSSSAASRRRSTSGSSSRAARCSRRRCATSASTPSSSA